MFDVIGDIHGHLDALTTLLRRMGYKPTGSSWRFPRRERRVLFVGDYIDRGPQIRETVSVVRGMVQAGDAIALIGNHEYNAILWHTSDEQGIPLRSHSQSHYTQHEATIRAYGVSPEGPISAEFEEVLNWFRTLPIAFENRYLRAVHAVWDREQIDLVGRESRFRDAPFLDREFLVQSATKGTKAFKAVETLLKGVEIPLPHGASYLDKDGVPRTATRIRWWNDRDLDDPVPINEIAMPPADTLPDSCTIPYGKIPFVLDTDPRPLFVGHYWLTGSPAPLSPAVACVDYSIARGGSLCAYRWDNRSGSKDLTAASFVCVPCGEGSTRL